MPTLGMVALLNIQFCLDIANIPCIRIKVKAILFLISFQYFKERLNNDANIKQYFLPSNIFLNFSTNIF
jgi:hypothetical protein